MKRNEPGHRFRSLAARGLAPRIPTALVALGMAALQSTACVVADDLPQPLVKLREAREAIRSGQVTWTFEDAARLPGRHFRLVSRMAQNGDRILEQRGDQDGWVRYEGATPSSKFPRLMLTNSDGVWDAFETEVAVQFWQAPVDPQACQNQPPTGFDNKDVRFLGIHPRASHAFDLGFDVFRLARPQGPQGAAAPTDVKYRVEGRDGMHVVRARWPDGTEATWTLDGARDWNPVRVEFREGDYRAEVRNELRKFGEAWFVAKAEHYVNGSLRYVFTVTDARFNAAADPWEFTGADIGLEVGYNVVPQNAPPSATRSRRLYWDGSGVVNRVTLDRKIATGEIEYGPNHQRFFSGESSPYATEEQKRARQLARLEMQVGHDPRAPLSDWDKYVKHFCKRHRLDAEQREKALQILKDCKDQADRTFDSHKTKLESIATALREARQRGDYSKLEALQKELAELLAPVQAVFEERLKPRLDTIPTAAQRAAASQPASRPARGP